MKEREREREKEKEKEKEKERERERERGIQQNHGREVQKCETFNKIRVGGQKSVKHSSKSGPGVKKV